MNCGSAARRSRRAARRKPAGDEPRTTIMATTPAKKTQRGPDLEPHQVILQPLVTEKGTHQFTRHNAYPFQVNLWATKDQIKAAVQELFNVRVKKVRTQYRQGKKR